MDDQEQQAAETGSATDAAGSPAASGVGAKAFTCQPEHYARGLLKITVPVSVNLASQKQSVRGILELGPGSILKFDKSCEELLELTVNDCPIAEGQVVKVGERFGLKIEQMRMPQEHFAAVKAGKVASSSS